MLALSWHLPNDSLIAVKRYAHHPGWPDRFTEAAPLAKNASPVEVMKPKLKTRAGRAAMRYAS